MYCRRKTGFPHKAPDIPGQFPIMTERLVGVLKIEDTPSAVNGGIRNAIPRMTGTDNFT
jgi:hypothetical protein